MMSANPDVTIRHGRLHFHCPTCHQRLAAAFHEAGQTYTCVGCEEEHIIPTMKFACDGLDQDMGELESRPSSEQLAASRANERTDEAVALCDRTARLAGSAVSIGVLAIVTGVVALLVGFGLQSYGHLTGALIAIWAGIALLAGVHLVIVGFLLRALFAALAALLSR